MISVAELDTGDMLIASFIGIEAGLGFALTMAFTCVFVKQLSVKDSTALIALSFSVITMLGGLSTLPLGWVTPGDEAYRYFVFAGFLGSLGHVISNEAVKRSDISVLGPFDYTAIIFALAIDVMVFGFVPNRLGLFGIFVIAFAALSLAVKQVRSAKILATGTGWKDRRRISSLPLFGYLSITARKGPEAKKTSSQRLRSGQSWASNQSLSIKANWRTNGRIAISASEEFGPKRYPCCSLCYN